MWLLVKMTVPPPPPFQVNLAPVACIVLELSGLGLVFFCFRWFRVKVFIEFLLGLSRIHEVRCDGRLFGRRGSVKCTLKQNEEPEAVNPKQTRTLSEPPLKFRTLR